MRRSIVFTVLLLGACGCTRTPTDTPDSVLQDMTSLVSRTADDLNKVVDAPTAEAARPKIRAAWEQYQDLTRRLDLAKQAPAARNLSTQSLKTSETQLKIAKKLAVVEWNRIAKDKNETWGQPFVLEFKDFVEALVGQPLGGTEERIIPPTVPF